MIAHVELSCLEILSTRSHLKFEELSNSKSLYPVARQRVLRPKTFEVKERKEGSDEITLFTATDALEKIVLGSKLYFELLFPEVRLSVQHGLAVRSRQHT